MIRPRPSQWSDRTLRRLAWTGWWSQLAVVLAFIPVDLLVNDNEGSWGWSQGPVQAMLDLVPLVFPLVGVLVLERQPRAVVGWVLMAIGAAWAVEFIVDGYAAIGLVLAPGSLPGAGIAAAVNEGSWAVFILLMGAFLILLFPDGRLPSRRWRPVAWAAGAAMVVVPVAIALQPGALEEGPVAGMVNPIGMEQAEGFLFVLIVVFLPLIPLTILASALGLVVRFRRSSGIERLQLKWLTFAGAQVALLYGLTMVATLVGSVVSPGRTPTAVTALQTFALVAFMLLPVAIGIAMLRYRLFDVDVAINRTVVYGALTVVLGAFYLGSVLLLRFLVSPLTGDSDLAVAGSTLAVAALFRPVRHGIQSVVDKRFYRRRYDAQRTLDAFGTRLRHELDLDSVGLDLRAAVTETVQPVHVRLWLRPGGGSS